jgi:hypothetical protein
MTTKTISSGYPSGITVAASYTYVTITSTGSIGGSGAYIAGAATVVNDGTAKGSGAVGSYGINLGKGGEVINYGYVYGFEALRGHVAGSGVIAATVHNSGTIVGVQDGIQLLDGGTIVNGYGVSSGSIEGSRNGVYVSAAASATITNNGYIVGGTGAGINLVTGSIYNTGIIESLYHYGIWAHGAATINNEGTVFNLGPIGVRMASGGVLVNGATNSTGALIESSGNGVAVVGALVANYATIAGDLVSGTGAVITGGGGLINGSATDHAALIEGGNGVYESNSSISNFGTIKSTATGFYHYSVEMNGGVLRNQSGGVIEGYDGATVAGGGTIDNYGLIFATGPREGIHAAYFTHGGVFANGSRVRPGAFAQGYDGVAIGGAAGTVANFGEISATGTYGSAVTLYKGGLVTNGGLGDVTALITGYAGVSWHDAASLANFGTIEATSGVAVFGYLGGRVVNGAATDQVALIEGYSAVQIDHVGTVINYGTIHSSNGTGAAALVAAGYVANGTASDTAATLDGALGAEVGGAGAVTNFGSIIGEGGRAVSLTAGGHVANGSGADTGALIRGVTGVDVNGAVGTVANFATIDGLSGYGVVLRFGGLLTNGAGLSHAALIEGYIAIEAKATATIRNSGTVISTASGHYGVYLGGGGSLTNGSSTNATALIAGNGGVELQGASTLANFGTVAGGGDTSGAGLYAGFTATGRLTNGAAGHAGALVEGYSGVIAAGTVTVTNWGTIDGLGGVAVQFKNAAEVLVVEAGSSFIGSILGGGGTLDLASGTGSITGMLSGSFTDGGPAASFSGFGVLDVGAGASFTASGTGAVTAGQSLIVAGSLTETGTLAIAGTLAGTGTFTVGGGTTTFSGTPALTIAKVGESGAAVIAFNTTLITASDVWTQTAGTLSVATGDRVNFTGTGDVFSGTLSGAGTVGFTGGTDTLSGTHIAAATTITSAGVTLAGAITLTKTLSVSSTGLTIAATGATLSGVGGILSLSNLATNVVKGATASALLTTSSGFKIIGAGQLGAGQMGLSNAAGATIEANATNALIINLGTNTLSNAGLIENISTGGLTITGAVANSGALTVTKGTLSVGGAVSGAGTVSISGGGTADFASSFTENVAFASTGGVLELAQSQAYGGQITGFAKTNVTKLDLLDIAFASGTTTASFSGTTASGTLTVTDGTHTAHINLNGDYIGSVFTAATDGHGGTLVTDPPKTKPPITIQPLVAAMAAFAGAGSAQPIAAAPTHADPLVLAAPRTMAA